MVDPIFNMFKIRFEILDKWNVIKDVKKARIFINVESVLKYIYTPRINEFLISIGNTTDVKRCLVSNMINLAQHYRLYFAKYKIPNEVFLYWNYPYKNDYLNKKYIPDYRSYYCNKMHDNNNCQYITECMDAIYDQLSTIIQYINEVYMITDTRIDSSLIPYIFYRDNDDPMIKNIVVSNSKYDFQYITYGFDVWKPDREDSIRLTDKNIIDYLKNTYKIVSKDTCPVNYLPFIISLLGDRYRNIPKINRVGLATILKSINKGLEEFVITERTTNIDMLSKCINEKYRDIFVNNYHCTSLPHQYEDMNGSIERDIFGKVIDKYDDTALQYLNDQYFKEHLIMMVDTRRDQIYNNMRR